VTDTRERILKAGLELWPDITQPAIADKVGITRQGVNHYFPVDVLKNAIAEYAIETECSHVIVQLMAAKDPIIDKISSADRIRHFHGI